MKFTDRKFPGGEPIHVLEGIENPVDQKGFGVSFFNVVVDGKEELEAWKNSEPPSLLYVFGRPKTEEGSVEKVFPTLESWWEFFYGGD